MSNGPIATLTDAPLAYGLLAVVLATSVIGIRYPGFGFRLRLYPHEVARMRMAHGAFTSAFVHHDWWHLIGNLLFAILFVPEVEFMLVDDFKRPVGWGVFLVVFFGIALFSALAAVVRYRSASSYSTLGISTVVFGMASFYYFYLPIETYGFGGIVSGNVVAYHMGCFGFILLLLAVRYRLIKAAPIHLYGAVSGLVMAILVRPALVWEIIAHAAGKPS